MILFSQKQYNYTKSCLKSIGEKGWGIGDRGETIHNWVFKVRSAVNHRIKNGFSIIPSISEKKRASLSPWLKNVHNVISWAIKKNGIR